jgi:hypothetical protein
MRYDREDDAARAHPIFKNGDYLKPETQEHGNTGTQE